MPVDALSEARGRYASVVAAIGEPGKDGVNPHFRNEYVTLAGLMAHLRPALMHAELSVVQGLTDGSVTTSVLCTKTGAEIEVGRCPLPPTADAQKMGSAVTYIRRYSLMAAFGLAGEDDDGNQATGQAATRPARTPTTPTGGGFEI